MAMGHLHTEKFPLQVVQVPQEFTSCRSVANHEMYELVVFTCPPKKNLHE